MQLGTSTHRAPRIGRDQRGFSAVELMVVVLIMGLTMALALPNLAQYNTNRALDQAVDEVESTLRRARSIAVTRAANVRVTLNPLARTISVDRDDDQDGTYDAQIILKNYSDRVDVTNVDFNGGATVVFDSRGIPSASGSVRLSVHGADPKELRLAAGSGAVTVLNLTP